MRQPPAKLRVGAPCMVQGRNQGSVEGVLTARPFAPVVKLASPAESSDDARRCTLTQAGGPAWQKKKPCLEGNAKKRWMDWYKVRTLPPEKSARAVP